MILIHSFMDSEGNVNSIFSLCAAISKPDGNYHAMFQTLFQMISLQNAKMLYNMNINLKDLKLKSEF